MILKGVLRLGVKPIVEMKGITKTFPGVKALSDVDFRLIPGEIHGLMGENGAGKSTLIKVLTGVHQPDRGIIYYRGKEIRPHNTLEAQKIGISTVYQEINLCPNLSIAENIFIGRQPMKRGWINWEEINTSSEKLLNRFDLNIDVTKPLSYYSVAIQQMVAIARALDISADVLILDEPTASLDKNEVIKLFEVMEQLKKEGIAIMFITHFIDNVFKVTDRVTILRNGKLVDEIQTNKLTKIELIAKMIGKDLETLEQLKEKNDSIVLEDKEILFSAKNIGNTNIASFDLDIYKGQVLGLAGLLGSGRTELASLLFGLDIPDQGEIFFKGKKVKINSPQKAMEYGISFCPEDRKTAGLIDDLSVRENIILALQVSKGYFKYLTPKNQEKIADKYIKMLNIATPDAEQKIKNLSGGNQQKVILARWLLTEPDLLILDEPTRGIDIGTKTEIQKLVFSLAEKGMSIIFISSEWDEVTRVSERVVVMKDRKKIFELYGDEITENNIMNMIAKGEG